MNPDTCTATATAVSRLNAKYGTKSMPVAETPVDVPRIIKALDEFMECVRYLNTRRTTATVLTLSSEADVQDAIYLMLRPWILDLVPEAPSQKVANRYSIKDFASQAARVVIEAKYIRDNAHGKSISKEINDDIEVYRYHSFARDIIFFIYDPNVCIPDQSALRRHVIAKREYEGIELRCHLIVKP